MRYKTKSIRFLGVHPGIASTGFAVVASSPNGYRLITSQLVKTDANDVIGKRLDDVHDALCRRLDKHSVAGIAIENVYHNQNVSSLMSTGQVIGFVEFTAYSTICLFTCSCHNRSTTGQKSERFIFGSREKRASENRKPSLPIGDKIPSHRRRCFVRTRGHSEAENATECPVTISPRV